AIEHRNRVVGAAEVHALERPAEQRSVKLLGGGEIGGNQIPPHHFSGMMFAARRRIERRQLEISRHSGRGACPVKRRRQSRAEYPFHARHDARPGCDTLYSPRESRCGKTPTLGVSACEYT